MLTDVKIEPIDFDIAASSITPGRAPAVFADRPLTLYGRIVGKRETIRLRVTARDSHRSNNPVAHVGFRCAKSLRS